MVRWFAPTALTAAIVVSACSTAPTTTTQGPATTSGEVPVRGGQFVIATAVEPSDLQPVTGNKNAARFLYDSFAEIDRTSGEVSDGMGRISQSRDGRTYTVEIDPRATWSDGTQIVAEDWLTTVKGIARGSTKCACVGGRCEPSPAVPRCPFAFWTAEYPDLTRILGWSDYASGRSSEIRGVRADGKRLTVELAEVRCAAIMLFAAIPPIPTHIFGRHVAGAAPSIGDAPENIAPRVVSGPFVLKEWRRGEHLVFGRNDRYWRGPALLDEVVLKVVARGKEVEQVASGAVMSARLEPERMDIGPLERIPSLSIHRHGELGYTYIGWNTRSETAPALRDARVRRALSFGVDLDHFVREVIPSAVRVHSHTPPSSWAYSRGLKEHGYDPTQAEALLRSAGYEKGSDGIYAKGGRRISFSLMTNGDNKIRLSLLQFAAEQYGRIGIEVRPQVEANIGTVAKKLDRNEFEASVIGWTWAGDPDYARWIWHSRSIPGTVDPTGAGNYARFANTELDRALDEAGSPTNGDCSIAARKRHYSTMDRILNEEQPYTFAYAHTRAQAVPTRLREFSTGPYFNFFGNANAHRWWLAPQK